MSMEDAVATRGSRLETYRVDGMTCQNCVRHAREAAESVAGVSRATVDLGRGRMTLRWDEAAQRDASAVVAAVGAATDPRVLY